MDALIGSYPDIAARVAAGPAVGGRPGVGGPEPPHARRVRRVRRAQRGLQGEVRPPVPRSACARTRRRRSSRRSSAGWRTRRARSGWRRSWRSARSPTCGCWTWWRSASRSPQGRGMNLNDLDEEAFVAALDGVVEHSPWVAREAYRRRPFASASELGSALADAMRDAPAERQVALVRAHPELSSRRAADGRVRLRAGRRGARPRAARRAARAERRLPGALRLPAGGLRARAHAGVDPRLGRSSGCAHSPEEELDTALGEIAKIARLRLEDRA